MIGSDVIQVLVVCSDRPTQSLFAEKLYDALPQEGNLRLTLHVDSSEVRATHNRSSLEAGMNLSKRCPPEAWPDGYWKEMVRQLANSPRATIAIQDATMNAHEFEAVVRAWLRQSYRVIPVFVYHREGNEWKIPAHTEFFRGYRVFPQGDEWMEKCSRSFAHYLYTLLRDQSLVDYGG